MIEAVGKFIEKDKVTAADPKTHTVIKACLDDRGSFFAKIAFLPKYNVGGKLEPYLKRYQIYNPMVSFMADGLQDVLINLGSIILKDTHLQKVHRTELTNEKLLCP